MRERLRTSDAARTLAFKALGCGDARLVKRLREPSRNFVYAVGDPVVAFVKIYRGTESADTCQREASALTALAGKLPVPRVLNHCCHADPQANWIITSVRGGRSLGDYLESASERDTRALLPQVAAAFCTIARSNKLRTAISELAAPLVGPYASGYSPKAWVEANSRYFAKLIRDLPEPRTVVVHGSASANNLLVHHTGTAPSLSGVIDLEGCREGSLGLDHAMLWYDFLSRRLNEAASVWLDVLRQVCDADVRRGFITNAAWLSAFRSRRRHSEQAQDMALQRRVREELQLFVRGAA